MSSNQLSDADSLETLETVVGRMPTYYQIDEWTDDVLELVHCMATIFRMGLRKGFAQMLFTNEPSFWPFVREFSAPETVMRVRRLQRELPLFNNQTEREHVWVMYTLNNADSSIYLQVIKNNLKLTKTFYSASGGCIFLNPKRMARLNALLLRMEKMCKFSLSPTDYVEFLKRKTSEKQEVKATPPVGELAKSHEPLPQGKLYSPFPMVSAHVAALEAEAAFTLEKPHQDPTPTNTRETSLSEETTPALTTSETVEAILHYDDPETPPTPKEDDEHIENYEEQGQKNPLIEPSEGDSDISDATEDYSPVSVLYASVIGDTPKPDTQQGPLAPSQGLLVDSPSTMAKRETLYSPPVVPSHEGYGESPVLSETALKRGEDELLSILERPKSSKVVIIEEPQPSSGLGHPVFMEAPVSPTSSSYEGGELGFFGISATLKRLTHIVGPFRGLFSGLVSLALGAITLATFSDDDSAFGTMMEEHDAFLDPELGKVVIRSKIGSVDYWSDGQASQSVDTEMRLDEMA